MGIALNPDAVEDRRAAGSVLHNDLGSRVIAIRLLTKDSKNKDTYIFLVSAYAPVGTSNQLLWDNFFDNIDTCLSRMHPNDILVVGADTNSSMGVRRAEQQMSSLGRYGIHHVNDSGRRFQSYLEMNNHIALTTYFQKKTYGTWIHPRSKSVHQIDHFITSKTDFPRFCDAGITASLIDSDHRAVFCKLKVLNHIAKPATPRMKLLHLDHTPLSAEEVQYPFCNNVISEMEEQEEEESGSLYSRLSSAAIAAAKKTLPKKPKASPGWFEAAKSTLLPLIEKRNSVLASMYKCRRSRSDTQRLRKVRKELKKEVQKAKNSWILQKCNELNESSTGIGGTKRS